MRYPIPVLDWHLQELRLHLQHVHRSDLQQLWSLWPRRNVCVRQHCRGHWLLRRRRDTLQRSARLRVKQRLHGRRDLCCWQLLWRKCLCRAQLLWWLPSGHSSHAAAAINFKRNHCTTGWLLIIPLIFCRWCWGKRAEIQLP